MFTTAELTSATDKLSNGKLTPADVSALVTVLRMIVGYLETEKDYDFSGKLTELDDTGNTEQNAAQVIAAKTKLEESGFIIADLGGRSNVRLSQEDQYKRYVIFIFSKLYPIPAELSSVSLEDILKKKLLRRRPSSSINSTRTY